MAQTGTVTEGKIARIMPFGVFVEMDNGESGLVHISEISYEYIKDIAEAVKIGDHVRVKVLNTDEKGRINLSIRQATEKKQKPAAEKTVFRPSAEDLFARNDENLSFEEKLLQFKQISDENMRALKRSAESKRSGGYSRKGNR